MNEQGRSWRIEEGKPIAKVLYHVTMSLDGFIAGLGHTMAWLSEADLGPQSEGLAVPETLGAALAGRNGYELGRQAGTP